MLPLAYGVCTDVFPFLQTKPVSEKHSVPFFKMVMIHVLFLPVLLKHLT